MNINENREKWEENHGKKYGVYIQNHLHLGCK